MKPIMFIPELHDYVRRGWVQVTLRVIRPQPRDIDRDALLATCRYGKPGDVLWVKETWGYEGPETDPGKPVYRLDGERDDVKWRSPLFMPKRFARTFIRIEEIGVIRVADITAQEAFFAGVHAVDWLWSKYPQRYQDAYAKLWDSLNNSPRPVRENGRVVAYEAYPFDSDQTGLQSHEGLPYRIYGNPWVWRIVFKKEVVK